jgi:tagatose-6-phosphate ketose/aldose isomerase
VKDLSEATKLLFENYSDLIKEITETDFRRAIFLGSGCLYGCAVESSLKLQEMTAGRIVCKADTFLGVRHGPEVVIDKETLVVYFLSTHPFTRRYELDLANEIEAKGLGMKKVAVCDKTDGEIERCADQTIEFNREGAFNISDLYRPVMDVTVGQLIGLFKSLDLGLKPDNPSEKGVITRVVKGVGIYDDKAFERDGKFRTIAS